MLISIVTINYNNNEGLKKTIQSVDKQLYKHIEFLVIDGKSDDGSLNTIKSYKNIITKYVSEVDDGIYDAMNKGAIVANGDFIIFMNSGDEFFDDKVLQEVVKHIDDMEKVYFCKVKTIYNNISWLYPSSDVNIVKWLKQNEPNHQGMFFPKSFYKYNFYNLSYKIAGDADYKHRALLKQGYYFINIISTVFELGGISSNPTSFKNILIQIKEVVKIDLIYRKRYITIIVTPIKFLLKFFLNKIGYSRYLKILKNIKGYR